MWRNVVAGCVFLWVVLPGIAAAQTDEPTGFRGTVVSADARRLPVAKARVRYRLGSVRGEVRTDKSGRFVVTGIRPGMYHVTVGASGFIPRDDVTIVVVEGAMTSLDIDIMRKSVGLRSIGMIVLGGVILLIVMRRSSLRTEELSESSERDRKGRPR